MIRLTVRPDEFSESLKKIVRSPELQRGPSSQLKRTVGKPLFPPAGYARALFRKRTRSAFVGERHKQMPLSKLVPQSSSGVKIRLKQVAEPSTLSTWVLNHT